MGAQLSFSTKNFARQTFYQKSSTLVTMHFFFSLQDIKASRVYKEDHKRF